MTTMSRNPSQELSLTRELSIEETYSLASVARRKSLGSKADLRQRLGTAQLLDALEHAIRNSPPPSPQQPFSKTSRSQQITWAQLDTPKREPKPEVDEFGFAYDDCDDEDDGLTLVRTQSRSL